MNIIKEFFCSISKNVWFGIKTSFLASKKYFLLKCLILLSTTVVPLINIWLWKEILNGIIDTPKDTVVFCLIIFVSIKLLTYLIARFDGYINNRYRDELQFYIEGEMMRKISRMSLSFFDSATMGDKVRHVRSNFDIMTQMTWLVFDILSEIVNIVVTFTIVCSYKWWIGLATVILLVPFMIYNKIHTDKILQMEKAQLRDIRKKDYYKGIVFDNDVQLEIKLNDIGGYFINHYKAMWNKLYKINKKETIRHNIINIGILVLNISSELLILLVAINDVLAKKIGIGDLQYNLSMVTRLRDQSTWLMSDINRFLVNNTRLQELQEFIAIKPEFEKSGKKLPSEKPKIEFCNVTFRYPNSEQYVLEDCSFVIEPYEKIGLIGLNGSGKSTIIKLLFRFYDPENGCIKLDDVDLKEYDIYAVRKVFGVMFQDFVRYCLPLREIIALSNFEERFDDDKLKKVCNISGASEIIEDWEEGFDSIIGRFYADNGRDLSGGQWQLIGLARAYFKESEFMILDEPSAALDAIAEDRIFEQLYHLSENKSSITISHRLSNTILTNKILVIEDGRIVEQGSHFDLLKQNGRYAHLFNLQASRYS